MLQKAQGSCKDQAKKYAFVRVVRKRERSAFALAAGSSSSQLVDIRVQWAASLQHVCICVSSFAWRQIAGFPQRQIIYLCWKKVCFYFKNPSSYTHKCEMLYLIALTALTHVVSFCISLFSFHIRFAAFVISHHYVFICLFSLHFNQISLWIVSTCVRCIKFMRVSAVWLKSIPKYI